MEEIFDKLGENIVMVTYDVGVSLQENPGWVTKTNTIRQRKFPLLSRFGATISDTDVSALLFELETCHKYLDKYVVFLYKNGRERILLEVPRNASKIY